MQLSPSISNIELLDEKAFKNYPIPIIYDSDEYYDLIFEKGDPLKIELKLKKRSQTYHHQKDDPSERLYQDWLTKARAFGIFDKDKLIGAIEVGDDYSGRLVVNLLWIDPAYRHNKLATALMDHIKKIMFDEHYRAIILETQSCNTKAIAFYLKQGFQFAGFDNSCYSNHDLKRHEVRFNFVYFNPKF